MKATSCVKFNFSCCLLSHANTSHTLQKRFIKSKIKNLTFKNPAQQPKKKIKDPFLEIKRQERKEAKQSKRKITDLEDIVKHAEEIQKESEQIQESFNSALSSQDSQTYGKLVSRIQTNPSRRRNLPTFDAEEAARLIPLNKYGEIDLAPEGLDMRFGKFMFDQQPKQLFKKVHKLEDLPALDLPEIAFAGRSNVGKSSLMNSLMHSKLVATSSTPGKTQSLDFFEIGKKPSNFFLVDMPGYGYHQAPKHISDNWPLLVKSYIESRGSRLKRVVVLIDSRHGFMQSDLDFMKFLDQVPVSYQVVLTKTDKISEKELDEIVPSIYEKVRKKAACFHHVALTSSLKSNGLEELRALLANATMIDKSAMGKHSVPKENRLEEISPSELLSMVNAATGKLLR